jgi:hypothetical protein
LELLEIVSTNKMFTATNCLGIFLPSIVIFMYDQIKNSYNYCFQI